MSHSVTVLVDPTTAAAQLGVKPGTLAKWRVSGYGPRHLKIGARVRYARADLEQWIERQRRHSTSEVPDAVR